MQALCSCPHCQTIFEVPEATLGKRAKCTQCGERFELSRYEPPDSHPPSDSAYYASLIGQPDTKSSKHLSIDYGESDSGDDTTSKPPTVVQLSHDSEEREVDKPHATDELREKLTPREFGESVLAFAFATARGFSVITIVLCTLLVTLSLVCAGLIRFWLREETAPPISVPTSSELQVYLDEKEESEDEFRGLRERATSPENEAILQLRKKHRLSAATVSYILDIEDYLSEDQHSAFVIEIYEFLSDDEIKDKDEAARWFYIQYVVRSKTQQADIRSDELHNSMIHGYSMVFLFASLYLFLGLMAFIAFPLLIKIERNTRLSVASH